MGILSGLFHSRDKPSNSTNGSSYRFLFGGSTSGNRVTDHADDCSVCLCENSFRGYSRTSGASVSVYG